MLSNPTKPLCFNFNPPSSENKKCSKQFLLFLSPSLKFLHFSTASATAAAAAQKSLFYYLFLLLLFVTNCLSLYFSLRVGGGSHLDSSYILLLLIIPPATTSTIIITALLPLQYWALWISDSLSQPNSQWNYLLSPLLLLYRQLPERLTLHTLRSAPVSQSEIHTHYNALPKKFHAFSSSLFLLPICLYL